MFDQNFRADPLDLGWSSTRRVIAIAYTPRSPTLTTAMARTSDWVQEQSAEDQTPRSDSETHDAQPVTPPPRNLDQEGRDNGMDRPPIDPPARPSLSTPKYDIATLLSLRHTQGAVPVMLRVKPEAIAGKPPVRTSFAIFQVD